VQSGLLIGVSEFKERGFTEGAAENADARGKRSVGESHGNGNAGQAGRRRDHSTVIAGRALQVAYQAGRVDAM